MIKIKLTEGQKMALKPLFDKAESAADKNTPGMIICQPFPNGTPYDYVYGDSDGVMRCDFIPTKGAIGLINVMDEYWEGLKNEKDL